MRDKVWTKIRSSQTNGEKCHWFKVDTMTLRTDSALSLACASKGSFAGMTTEIQHLKLRPRIGSAGCTG